MTARAYCFTSYIDPGFNEENVDEKIRYIIYQKEKCPKTGKTHWQGYVELRTPLRVTGVKKIFKNDALHLEVRRGTKEQAIAYCEKIRTSLGDKVELGEAGGHQGKRSDLLEVSQKITSGKHIKDIALEHPTTFIKFFKGLNELKNVTQVVDGWRNVEVIVYWGKSGVGKTRKAIEESEGDYFKLNTNTNGTLWFDGYNGEKTLILDDFYGWIKWGELLTLLDGYKYRCQIKGSYTWAQWTKVIITSNKPPQEWYTYCDIEPLLRRISIITEIQKMSRLGSGGVILDPPVEFDYN